MDEATDRILDRLQAEYGPPREWEFSLARNRRMRIIKYQKAYEVHFGGDDVWTCKSPIELVEYLAEWYPGIAAKLAEPV